MTVSDDPLAGFRRQGQRSAALLPSEGERRRYEPFNSKDNQRRGRLNIRRKGGKSHALGYNFIIDIAYDGDNYTAIVLIMSSMLVKMRGRNLRPIVDSLILGTCEYIQEFRNDLFDKPGDANAPFVEVIEVVTGGQQEKSA